MRKSLLILTTLLLIISCNTKPKEMGWVFEKEIILEGINPIGIAKADTGFWLSDGDHNRVVQINLEGQILKSIDSLDRPMHISINKGELVIPQYGNDQVLRIPNPQGQSGQKNRIRVSLLDSLDAPAGADINDNEIAIADFYNNKIHFANQSNDWIIFGTEGKNDGEFYYPTDVQLTADAIWVADAYNHRIQKFDKNGKHLLTIGEDQQMNAATGLFVSDTQVIATDFENNRILAFGLEGTLVQELKQRIQKPTDIIVVDDKLYVTNYKGSSLSVYTWGELTKVNSKQE